MGMPSALNQPRVALYSKGCAPRRWRVVLRHEQPRQTLAVCQAGPEEAVGVQPEIGLAVAVGVGGTGGVRDRIVADADVQVVQEHGGPVGVVADHLSVDDIEGRQDRENGELQVHAVHPKVVCGEHHR